MLEKSDGIRYIFYCQPSKTFLIDRNLFLRKFPSWTYKKMILNNLNGHSFFDGELSFNLLTEGYESLIYDVFCLDNDWRIASWDLKGRINSLDSISNENTKKNPQNHGFIKKDLFPKTTVFGLFRKIHLNTFSFDHLYFNKNRRDIFLCNKNDGIIFSPIKSIFLTKNPLSVLKWKFENGNTLDFLSKKKKIRIKNTNTIQLDLYCRNFNNQLFYFKTSKRPFFKIYKSFFKNTRKNFPIDEFFFDRKTGEWFRMKPREDKQNPNSLKVLINTLQMIAELFFFNELIDEITKSEIRYQRGKFLKIIFHKDKSFS